MPMTIPSNGADPASQSGVMLLEALISIAIFSIGVLGLIGLQSAAIKNSTDAKQRAAAAFYANQIVGQMWSDDHATLSSYAHYAGGTASSQECSFSGTASANAKVVDWVTAIRSDLNGSAAAKLHQIRVGADNVVNVTLCWKNPEEAVYHWFTTVAQIQG